MRFYNSEREILFGDKNDGRGGGPGGARPAWYKATYLHGADARPSSALPNAVNFLNLSRTLVYYGKD